MRKSDKDILNHILAYCEDVEKTINRFGNNPGTFDSDVGL